MAHVVHSDVDHGAHSDHDTHSEDDITGCPLGHCAIAAGFILSGFALIARLPTTAGKPALGDFSMAGGVTAFEPPPPKV